MPQRRQAAARRRVLREAPLEVVVGQERQRRVRRAGDGGPPARRGPGLARRAPRAAQEPVVDKEVERVLVVALLPGDRGPRRDEGARVGAGAQQEEPGAEREALVPRGAAAEVHGERAEPAPEPAGRGGEGVADPERVDVAVEHEVEAARLRVS